MAQQDTNSSLSSNRQEIEKYLVDAAKNYFGTSNVDFYKSGLLGFEIEKLSEMFSDLMIDLAFRADERFINTAKRRKSVNLIADEFSYVEEHAIPSEIFVSVAFNLIPSDYFVNSDVNVPNYTSFKLDCKDFELNSRGVVYSLPGDTLIQRSYDKWFVTLENNDNFEYSLGILTSEVINDDVGNSSVNFSVLVKQIEISTVKEILPKRSQLVPYSFIVDAPANTQFFDSSIYYFKVDQSGENIRYDLDKIDSFATEASDITKDVYTLEQLTATSFRVFLGGGTKFKFLPTGTELNIELFTTVGVEGEVVQPSFIVLTKDTLQNRTITAISNLNSTTARNSLSFDELKRDVLAHIQTPDQKTVVTNFDYNNVFSKYFHVLPDDILTLIRRNDPIRRVTEIFVKMVYNVPFTEDYQVILSTNTIDVRIVTTTPGTLSDFNVKPYTIIKLEKDVGFGVIVDTAPTTEELMSDDRYYITTMYRVLNNQPLRQSVYVLNSLNFTYPVDYQTFLANNTNFSIFSDVKVMRQVIDESTSELFYTMQLSSNNYDMMMIEIGADSAPADQNVVGYLRLIDPTTNLDLGYIKLNRATAIAQEYDDNDISGSFKILNHITNNQINATDIYSSDGLGGEIFHDVNNTLLLPKNVEFKSVVTLIDPSSIINQNITPTAESVTVKAYWEDYITDIVADTFINIEYTSDENMVLFHDYTEMFFSEIEEVNDTTYTIKNVQLFSYEDWINDDLSDYFDTIQGQYINFADGIKNVKEEPNTIALKFFNSYGPSDNYSGTDYADISFNFEVTYLVDTNIEQADEELKTLVLDYIKEKSTTHSSDLVDRHIYLSDIISLIETSMTAVRQVRILNYLDNLYYVQKTVYEEMTQDEAMRFVPSIINLRRENITISKT